MSLDLYFYSYWSIVTLCTFIAILQVMLGSGPYSKSSIWSFLPIVALIILIPYRPVCFEMADTVVYAQNFESADFDVYEFGFKILGNICSKYTNLYFFFLIAAAVTLFSINSALKNFYQPKARILLLSFMSSLVAWSMLHNALRQGIALSFAFLAITLWNQNKKYAVLWLILAVLFHNSTIFFFAAAAGIIIIKEIKYYFAVWSASVLVSLLDIPAKLFSLVSFINPEKFMLYTETYDASSYKIGFRFDFLIYSMLPFAIYYFCKYFNENSIQDKCYENLLKWYILLNSIWILCIRLPFSDRFAMPSWVLLSTLVIYPLIKIPNLKNRLVCSGFLLVQLAFSVYSCVKHTLFREI